MFRPSTDDKTAIVLLEFETFSSFLITDDGAGSTSHIRQHSSSCTSTHHIRSVSPRSAGWMIKGCKISKLLDLCVPFYRWLANSTSVKRPFVTVWSSDQYDRPRVEITTRPGPVYL